ncbi:MAG: CDP-alcohol phosphatidyltransferase family protein [Candidatus Binatia bacterium]
MLDSLLGRPGGTVATALDRLAHQLVRRGVTPNALTYSALAIGLAGAALFWLGHGWSALLVLLLSGMVDAVDGRVARLGRGPTPWGGVLDLTSDRIVEAAVLLAIAAPFPERHLPALVLACTWYVNLCVFLAVGAASDQQREKIIVYPPGLLERSEALLFATAVVVAPGWVVATAYVYAFLGLVTAAQRLRYGRRALSSHH